MRGRGDGGEDELRDTPYLITWLDLVLMCWSWVQVLFKAKTTKALLLPSCHQATGVGIGFMGWVSTSETPVKDFSSVNSFLPTFLEL